MLAQVIDTPTTANPATPPRNRLRSIGAVLLGFVVVVVLSLGTDQLLHVLAVYPPWGQPMHDPGLNLLALGYRVVYQVFGSYLTARFAPRNPMRHVWVGAAIGFVLASLGAVAAINAELGPMWYPVALAISALPCAWLGGRLHTRRAS
jgi:hypothetical protein